MFDKIPEKTMQYLVTEAQKGNSDAFGNIYDALVTPIYRYIYYRVGSKEDAEDLTEQVFLKAWESIGSYKPQGGFPFSSWMYRIAHNMVVDSYREKSKYKSEELNEEMEGSDADSPRDFAARKMAQKDLTAALTELPQNYQDILVLRFINELSTKEICGITGKSEEAIRVLQFRALKSLKNILGADHGFAL